MRLERWLYTIPLRLRSLFRGPDVDRELDEELAAGFVPARRATRVDPLVALRHE